MSIADQCQLCRLSCQSDRRTGGHFERVHLRHFVITCAVHITSTHKRIASMQYLLKHCFESLLPVLYFATLRVHIFIL